MQTLDDAAIDLLRRFQKDEINEHNIYKQLSLLEKDQRNREVLTRISDEELHHYKIWKAYTGADVKPDTLKIFRYLLIAKIFGVTFCIKLMENGEKRAQINYGLLKDIPEAEKMIADENSHEEKIIALLDEERLKYMGSVVLGLNDALVELTGALAGLTFALQNGKLVGMAGLITGIAASLSMAASEYLSTKADEKEKSPLRASIYTGMTYVFAVAILILPFLLLNNPFLSLAFALTSAILLIGVFTFYYSVVRDVSFKKRFLEMAGISIGVSALSFVIGLIARRLLGADVP